MNVKTFVEEELAGVTGVRWQEILERFGEEGGEDPEDLRRELLRYCDPHDYPIPEGRIYEWKPWPKLSTEVALRRLLGYPDWAETFVMFCKRGPDKVCDQAWQFLDALIAEGCRAHILDARDQLLDLAAELLPDSPAGAPEAHGGAKGELLSTALRWANSRSAEEKERFSSALDADDLQRAWEAGIGPLRGFLRERMRKALRPKGEAA